MDLRSAFTRPKRTAASQQFYTGLEAGVTPNHAALNRPFMTTGAAPGSGGMPAYHDATRGAAMTGNLSALGGGLPQRVNLEQALTARMGNHRFGGNTVARQDAQGRAYFAPAVAAGPVDPGRLAYAQQRQQEREMLRGVSPSGVADGVPLSVPQMRMANVNHQMRNPADANPLFSDLRQSRPMGPLAQAVVAAAPVAQGNPVADAAAAPVQTGPLSYDQRLAQRQANVVANAQGRAQSRRNRLEGGGQGFDLMAALTRRNPVAAAQMAMAQQRLQQEGMGQQLERDRFAFEQQQGQREFDLRAELGRQAMKLQEQELAQGESPKLSDDSRGNALSERETSELSQMEGNSRAIVAHGKSLGWSDDKIAWAVKQYGGNDDAPWLDDGSPTGSYWSSWLPGGDNPNYYRPKK